MTSIGVTVTCMGVTVTFFFPRPNSPNANPHPSPNRGHWLSSRSQGVIYVWGLSLWWECKSYFLHGSKSSLTPMRVLYILLSHGSDSMCKIVWVISKIVNVYYYAAYAPFMIPCPWATMRTASPLFSLLFLRHAPLFGHKFAAKYSTVEAERMYVVSAFLSLCVA